MASKGRRKRDSKDSITSNTANNNSIEKRSKESGNGGSTKKKISYNKALGCDIFTDAAMENAYYVCHNVQDVLKSRGFAWPDGQKRKKKGKR